MKLMTKTKAMNELGIGRKRFDRLWQSGQIEAVKVGDSFMFPLWSIEQCLKQQ